jgi:16S rRNA (guanine527-N7)-methyltransferase
MASRKSKPALPELTEAELGERLAAVSPVQLSAATVRALFIHYRELRRWNLSLSLIGPGTIDEVIARHYGESLAGRPWIEAGWRQMVDLGSGGGFPGLVLAAAAPWLAATLVESRGRKAAFLRSVAGKAALNCRCLDVRVCAPLPPGLPEQIDLLTARAIKLPPSTIMALTDRLTAGGRLFLWAGQEAPEMPATMTLDRALMLPGSENRRILSYRPIR